MTIVNSYIAFSDKKAREALNFYRDCLGAEIEISTIGESPIAAHMPTDMQDGVLHGILKKDGNVLLMASDMIVGQHDIGNNVSLMIQCGNEIDIRNFYSSLLRGGIVRDELGVKFWGGMFGAITDKFGINWSMNYEFKQP